MRSLPRLTSTSIPRGASAAEIDRLVREAGDRDDSTFHIEAGALRGARPDVILGQTICRVCAVTLDQLPAGTGITPRTIPLTGTTLEGVLEDIARAAEELGVPERGSRLVADLRERIRAVASRVAGRPRPRVACIEWLDPIFPGGHWVPEQVEIAGGIDALWTAGVPSIDIEWERVVDAAPDVIVLMPCGFGTDRALADAGLVTSRAGFADLPAARRGEVYAANGSAYFSRPGPRLVDGIEILAALLHPDAFPAPPADAARRVPLPLAAR